MSTIIYTDASQDEICNVIIQPDSSRTIRLSVHDKTVNEAEYLSVINALKLAQTNKWADVQLYTDSQLVARQLSGEYGVKAKNLKRLCARALEYVSSRIRVAWVPRERNIAGWLLEGRPVKVNQGIEKVQAELQSKSVGGA